MIPIISPTQTMLQRISLGKHPLQASFWGYLEFHPIASVDCHIVRALQEVVEGQRQVVAGVDVTLRVGEAHAAQSWGGGRL